MKIEIPFGITTKKVFITDDWDLFCKKCKKYIDGFPNDHKLGKNIVGQTSGSIIYLRDYENTITLVHELIHAADNLIESYGFYGCSELRAYLVDGVMRIYVQKVLGWRQRK